LPASPTLDQVVRAVNANSTRIRSFWTNQATLSVPGSPMLRANIAFERPLRFRLRGDTAFTGSELDLGSNDEAFWIWVRRNQPPALYYARHDRFASSPARRAIPIEPAWLIEALGIAEFDPALPHEGPAPARNGQLEIRTVRETPEGPATKVTIIDGQRALVMGQVLFDPRGQLTARTTASQHRRDPASGLVMPRVVEISCPIAQFSMRIDLGNVTINQLRGDPVQLFSMPSYEGYPLVDLCNPVYPRPAIEHPGAFLRPTGWTRDDRSGIRDDRLPPPDQRRDSVPCLNLNL
jgi:hypothetical protein